MMEAVYLIHSSNGLGFHESIPPHFDMVQYNGKPAEKKCLFA